MNKKKLEEWFDKFEPYFRRTYKNHRTMGDLSFSEARDAFLSRITHISNAPDPYKDGVCWAVLKVSNMELASELELLLNEEIDDLLRQLEPSSSVN